MQWEATMLIVEEQLMLFVTIGINIILVGKQDKIESELKFSYDSSRIRYHTDEIIEMHES
jgi:fatty acid/phospholipid biosynthesis enzyme